MDREDKLRDLVKAAVTLAIVRHGLVTDDEPNMDDETMELIADDTFDAIKGIGTCAGKPIPEWAAVTE